MGLFDKLLGGQSSAETALDKREAFTSILLVVVAADGDVSAQEAEEIVAISNRMRLYQGQAADQFNTMIEKLVGLLNKHGSRWLIDRACSALPTELAETAFAVAADLVFADGSVEPEEQQLLELLRERLQVPADLAMKIVEVLVVKNRG